MKHESLTTTNSNTNNLLKFIYCIQCEHFHMKHAPLTTKKEHIQHTNTTQYLRWGTCHSTLVCNDWTACRRCLLEERIHLEKQNITNVFWNSPRLQRNVHSTIDGSQCTSVCSQALPVNGAAYTSCTSSAPLSESSGASRQSTRCIKCRVYQGDRDIA